MQFLWTLIPGAREARNQVLVGYAWLAAIGIWIGLPHPSKNGHVHALIAALGHVGVGIAASFAAFIIGSLSDDIVSEALSLRGAAAFTARSEGGLDFLNALGDSGRAELGRLEGALDRANSELLLRVSLIPPLLVAAAASQRYGFRWPWLVASLAAAAALVFQTRARRVEFDVNQRASERLRLEAERISQGPD